MRTTLTIDPDVERLLRQAMLDRHTSMARIVNDALRAALAVPTERAQPYEFPTYDCGPALVDLTKAGALSDALEDEAILQKLAEDR